VRERVVREHSGNMQYPTLTRSNYAEWAMVMRVQLQAAHLWDVIEYGADEDGDDRAALAALLRAVPPELVRTLAVKDCTKTAWETIKTMRLGCERVREAKAQTRRREWEELRFKPNESIEDFSIRLTAIINDLELLGDPVEEYRAVLKYLRVVPKKYRPMVMAIEQTVNLRTLTIEEVTGRLITAEEGYDLDDVGDGVGKLLLTEEEWAARQKKGAPGGGSSGKTAYKPKPHDTVASGNGGGGNGGANAGNGERRKGNCRYCGKPGHWAKECRKAKRDREQQQQANLVQAEEDQAPAMMMAVVTETVAVAPQAVFLNEEKVIPVPSPDGLWYFDTGASSHMTGLRHVFATLDETVHGTVRFGDGSVVDIHGKGLVIFRGQSGEQRILADVYLIPSLRSNIISVGQLDEGGYKIAIADGMMTIHDPVHNLLARVKRAGNRLYTGILTYDAPVCLMTKGDDMTWRWHARFGHLHFRALHTMSRRGMVRGLPDIARVEEMCDGCALGKQHRAPFPRTSSYRAERGFELVHTDLCGPITPATIGGNSYFLLVVDDFSRYMWLEVLKAKSDAFRRFTKIKAAAEAVGRCKLRGFRSDRGGEFNSGEFKQFCDETGIVHYTTAPYSPQQNGVVERRNQTVVEMARCLLKSMKVPPEFWGEAVRTAVYLLNRAPTRSLNGVTPYELWHGWKPNVQHLRVFGCVAHVKKIGPRVNKLADRSSKMIFIGYEEGSKCYRVYDPISKKLQVSRDIMFEENRSWEWQENGSAERPLPSFTVEYALEDGTVELDAGGGTASTNVLFPAPAPSTPSTANTSSPPSTATPPSINPAASASPSSVSKDGIRWATPTGDDDAFDPEDGPLRYRRLSCVYNDTEGEAIHELEEECMLAAEEPHDIDEAIGDAAWRTAMDEEMTSITENNTWEMTTLPRGHKAIGLKWVFKVKRDAAGNLLKHKARLVAKGYAQRQGVDFEEVFAPVARMETVRLLLALAAHSGWEVHHMDVKSAFLNGVLSEEVYVSQPPGYIADGKENAVLKLNKALYGLRQAPRAWYAKLHDSLTSLGFVRSPSEHAVYRRGDSSSYLLVGVYVDDLIITGTDTQAVLDFKEQMKQLFRMSDLGLLSYYLGIEVVQAHGQITLCQKNYVEKILEIAGMSNCNSSRIPMECRLKLRKKDDAERADKTLYRSVIGSLRYLVNTRPDIALAVGIASRFMEDPTAT
jgi:transposase InsO family protein